jgi:hypothetical protein
MAETQLALVVTLNDQGVVTGFQQLNQAQDEVIKKGGETDDALKSTEEATGALGGAAKIAALAIAGITAAGVALVAAIGRGDKFNDIADAFNKLAEKAGLVGDEFLNGIAAAVDETVPKLDLMAAANKALIAGLDPTAFDEVAQAAKKYADANGIEFPEAMDRFTRAITKGSEAQLQQLGLLRDGKIVLEGISQATDKYKDSQRGANDTLDQAKAKFQNLIDSFASTVDSSSSVKLAVQVVTAVFNGLVQATLYLGKQLIYFADAVLNRIKKEIENVTDGFAVLGEVMNQIARREFPSFGAAIDKVAKEKFEALKDQIKEVPPVIMEIPKTAKEAMKEAADAIEKAAEEVKAIQKEMTSFDDFMAEMIGEERFPELRDQIRDAFELRGEGRPLEFVKAINDVNASFIEGAKGSGELSDRFNILRSEISGVSKEFDLLAEAQKRAEEESKNFEKALASTISGALSTLGDSLSKGELSKDTFGSIAGSFGELFGPKAFGTDFFKKNIGDLGEFTGPLGQIFGGAIATSLAEGLYSGLSHVFGAGTDEETQARKDVDRFFADLFNENELQVIIEGQLKRIKDLTFGNDTDIFDTGTFDDLFASLPDAIRQGFAGIGTAFEELVANGDLASGQLAAVLVNNIGGSLNNLQLLVEATGKSFDEMKDAVTEAFLDGKLSIDEAHSALLGIQQVAQKGIPDAFGATVEAVLNLQAAGTKGGRALIDALQDIGYEAKELSINDFPALQEQLLASGQFSAESIQAIFDSLHTNGIDTIEQLVNATAQQLIPVLASLEAANFPFKEAMDTATDFVATLEKIPASKDVEINLRINTYGDSNALNNAVLAQGSSGGRVLPYGQ